MRPEVLDPATIDLPGWAVTATGVSRDFQAPEFLVAVELIHRMAPVMEEMDHHADVDLRWRRVHVHLFTHEPEGVTTHVVDQARRWDAVAAKLGCS